MASILIAGCGDIGCSLGLKLAELGHKVYGLRRDVAKIPSEISAIEADLSCDIFDVPSDIDFVFYTAAAAKYNDFAYYQSYVAGVKNTLASLEKAGAKPKRFFFISSTSVFGQSDGEWVTESSPTTDANFSTKRLLEGEELALNSSIPATVVRFGGIYGPGRTRIIDLVVKGKAQCVDGVYSNRIHTDDCVGVLSHLMQLKKLDNLYIAVDNEPTLLCDVYEWLAEQLSVGSIEYIEPTENSRLMRSNKRLSNEKLRSTGYDFVYPSYREGYASLV